jgi:hypothetical protein
MKTTILYISITELTGLAVTTFDLLVERAHVWFCLQPRKSPKLKRKMYNPCSDR